MGPEMVQVCDVCGADTAPVQTVTFFVERAQFDVDVCPPHQASLSEARARLASYSTVGRSHSLPGGRSPDAAKVRAWAHKMGLDVGHRGRLSDDVHKKYQRAMEVEVLSADVMSNS